MTLRRSFLVFFLISSAFAQKKDPAVYVAPPAQQPRIRAAVPSRELGLTRPDAIVLGALSVAERAQLGPLGPKRRIGVHRAVPDRALARGTWTALADGRSIWRAAIRSNLATQMRVEFSNFDAGDGKVWVHSARSFDGPYSGRGPYGNGEFWSATVEGDSLVIEYQPADASSRSVPFHVHRIAHHEYRVSDAPPQPVTDPAASCNLDVNCYPDWQASKKSVAQIEFEETQGPEQGTFLCSGALVGTRDNSFIPYLLTAGHCIHDEAAARSLETFWGYESDGCNLGPPATRGTLNSQNGGHLLAWGTIEHGDYSLVLLPNVPSGVVFSGWDTGDPNPGLSVTGIHHPMGSYKRIAFGSTVDSVDVLVGSDPAPAEFYHDVIWDTGLTEPGSSGSPLFSGPGVIVGMLTYGPAVPGEEQCALGSFGGYGKFSNAYPYLQAYLEDFAFSQVTPSSSSLQFSGRNHAIVTAPQTVSLSVKSPEAVNWYARADAPWILISQNSGTVSSASPASFSVTVDPKYFVASDTYTSTITILSGAAPPVFVNVSVKMQLDISNVLASANPNPVAQSNGAWSLSLNLNETGGAATTLTELRIDGADYTSNIPVWFGSTHLAANGSLNATIHTTGLLAPVTKYFEFFGRDDASGQTWYRLLTVTFTN